VHIEPVGDDLTIGGEAQLWRRVHPDWIVFDANVGRARLSSQAFQNLVDDKLSVLLEEIVRAGGRTPLDVLAQYSGYCLASFSVGFARQYQQIVVRAPEPDEPAHCHLIGKKNKSVQRALAKQAEWVIPPTAR
jgi:hypothetical protein